MKIAFLVRRPAEEGPSITRDVAQLLRAWRAGVDLIKLDPPARQPRRHPAGARCLRAADRDRCFAQRGRHPGAAGARCVNLTITSARNGTRRDEVMTAVAIGPGPAGIP